MCYIYVRIASCGGGHVTLSVPSRPKAGGLIDTGIDECLRLLRENCQQPDEAVSRVMNTQVFHHFFVSGLFLFSDADEGFEVSE